MNFKGDEPNADDDSVVDTQFEIDEDELMEKMNYLIHETEYFNQATRNEEVSVFLLYMTNKKLENYKKLCVPLKHNVMTKDELVSIILKNKNVYGNKYTINGIFKYNFALDKEQLKDFILNDDTYNFMTPLEKISEIKFDVSIDIFQNFNNLFIFLNNNSKRKTRKKVAFTDHVEISTSKGKTLKHKMNE